LTKHNGLLNFWAAVPDSVAFRGDNLEIPESPVVFPGYLYPKAKPVKRVICSCCGAHLGHIFDDGPYPFYRRYSVNCASLNFRPKPFWQKPKVPDILKRKYREELKKLLEEKRKNDAKIEEMFKLVKINHNAKLT